MLIVSVVSLTIDRALPVTLLTTRQQLVEAQFGPPILSCTSTAPQLNQAGWACFLRQVCCHIATPGATFFQVEFLLCVLSQPGRSLCSQSLTLSNYLCLRLKL